jgi:hypothetical protein
VRRRTTSFRAGRSTGVGALTSAVRGGRRTLYVVAIPGTVWVTSDTPAFVWGEAGALVALGRSRGRGDGEWLCETA